MAEFGVIELYLYFLISAPKGTPISILERMGHIKILTPGIDAEWSIYLQIIIVEHIFV